MVSTNSMTRKKSGNEQVLSYSREEEYDIPDDIPAELSIMWTLHPLGFLICYCCFCLCCGKKSDLEYDHSYIEAYERLQRKKRNR